MAFIKHKLSCPKCGGSDPVSLNDDGSAKCFSCETYFLNYNKATEGELVVEKEVNTPINPHGGDFVALTDRRISEATARKYGVKSILTSNGEIVQHIYPYYNKHEISATKTRYIRDKNFSVSGSFNGTGLFGEQLFQSGGKAITIVEGECDAMACYELMGSKWASVSIKRGASGAVKDIKESLEFLESFESIVICFDNDKQGMEASKKVAMLFQPSKAKIMSLPNGYKDANDMLKQNKHKEFIEAWWASKVYTPSGVINVSESRAEFFDREKKESVEYPWKGLNDKLYGLRAGELVTLTGGTGLGKSSVTRELEHWLIKETTDNVGVIALEEDWRRTVDGILSIEANARLYIDQVREQFTPEELDKFFDILYDGDNENRVWIHAHFGTNNIDEIFNKIRFMIIACDCKWVVVDHLHMLVSALSEGDERTDISITP